MHTRIIAFLSAVLIFAACGIEIKESEFSQWRGKNRDGIYQEKNLLKEWPEEGPALLWSYEGIGAGHGSAAITKDKIFVTGMPDTSQTAGVLSALDHSGNLIWKKEFGPDWNENFPGSRSTPTIVDDLIYLESGSGKVYCLKTSDGSEVWSIDFFEDLKADSLQFGFSESVLIDSMHLICVPGGIENNVVALNRFTGEKIWSSKGYGEPATYNSPILVNHNDQRLVIAMSSSSIMGIDADTGEMYWRIHQFQDNKIHANTPLYKDGKILVASVSSRDSSGLVLLQLSDDGKNADILWRNERFRNFMGGLILKDGFIYGSAYLKKDWQCINWETGESQYTNKELSGGAIIYADGLYYCYTEREGEIALVNATPDTFDIISKFPVPLGEIEHWAHPVIKAGKLYVRHGNALMAYDILSN